MAAGPRRLHGVPQAKKLGCASALAPKSQRTERLLLADFTAITFLGEGEWKTKKHGAQRRRQWRKLHREMDAETLQIRAISVATNAVGDSSVAAEL